MNEKGIVEILKLLIMKDSPNERRTRVTRVSNRNESREAWDGKRSDDDGKPSMATVVATLLGMQTLKEEDMRVVGHYCRSDETDRSRLKSWVESITASLCERVIGQADPAFMVQGGSGSGKTYLFEQVAAALGPQIDFRRLNLAETTKEDFIGNLNRLDDPEKPTLALIDEIDSRGDTSWPYDVLFPHLDAKTSRRFPVAFAVAGSAPGGLEALVTVVRHREKGNDLLTRIPVSNRFEIPPLRLEDRAVVFAANVRSAAADNGVHVSEVEKLAIFFLLVSSKFAAARELRHLAYSSVSNCKGAERLHYSDLFRVGDSTDYEFYSRNFRNAKRLTDRWVRI